MCTGLLEEKKKDHPSARGRGNWGDVRACVCVCEGHSVLKEVRANGMDFSDQESRG